MCNLILDLPFPTFMKTYIEDWKMHLQGVARRNEHGDAHPGGGDKACLRVNLEEIVLDPDPQRRVGPPGDGQLGRQRHNNGENLLERSRKRVDRRVRVREKGERGGGGGGRQTES